MTGKTTDKPDKPKRGRLKIVLGAVLLICAGAGGAFAANQMGYLGHASAKNEINAPRLVRKGDSDPYAPADDSKDKGDIVDGEGGSAYRTSYFSFEEPFTANLRGSSSLIQVHLAASTQRDGRVLQWMHKHELALRSVILVELAETSVEEASGAPGKKRLQKRLAVAINKVLEQNEGFGGVDNVHFQGYLVQ